MLACSRFTTIRSGSKLSTLIAMGGLLFVGHAGLAHAATAKASFEFIRGEAHMARIDTATGQVSTVASNGDGGWNPIGLAPSDAGKPSRPGRYGLLRLKPERSMGRAGRATMLEPVIRIDRATGRAWRGELTQFTHWREFGSDAAAPAPPPEEPAPVATSASKRQQEPQLKVLSKKTLDEAGGLSKDDVAVFIEAINKPGLDSEVRVWATLQLGAVDPDLSVPPLLQALESDDPRIVAAAVQALAQTGVASVVPQILELESHPDPSVRAAVASAVKRVD
jgi:hypothetical protein